MNRSEIKGNCEGVGNTTRQLTPKRELQVGRGLFGVPKYPKITQTFTQNRKTVVIVISIEI